MCRFGGRGEYSARSFASSLAYAHGECVCLCCVLTSLFLNRYPTPALRAEIEYWCAFVFVGMYACLYGFLRTCVVEIKVLQVVHVGGSAFGDRMPPEDGTEQGLFLPSLTLFPSLSPSPSLNFLSPFLSPSSLSLTLSPSLPLPPSLLPPSLACCARVACGCRPVKQTNPERLCTCVCPSQDTQSRVRE